MDISAIEQLEILAEFLLERWCMLSKNVNLTEKTILVTGAAGFIGANLVMELLSSVPDIKVIGLDSVNDYYDVSLKE